MLNAHALLLYFAALHTVQGKIWDHFCASAEGAVSDSVFPSMIAHCGAIGMGDAVNWWVGKAGGVGPSTDRPVGTE